MTIPVRGTACDTVRGVAADEQTARGYQGSSRSRRKWRVVGGLGPKAPEDYFIFRRDYLVEIYRHFQHRVQPEYDVDFFWIKADSVSSIASQVKDIYAKWKARGKI